MTSAIQRLLIYLMLVLGPFLQAHSLHQSTAEAEYNTTTGKLEVSLTVFIDDFELALMRHSERLMSFEKTPAVQIDAEAQAYLAKSFVVMTADKVSKIEWMGRQVDKENAKSDEPTLTLFFEIALPSGLVGCSVRHAVLCDLFKDQTNLLHLRNGAQRKEYRFVSGDPARLLAPVASP
jgi:hypothetical protein